MNIHRFRFTFVAAGWLLALALTTPAEAVSLANCRDHCIGTCKCIARTTPDCNCNVFSCNCGLLQKDVQHGLRRLPVPEFADRRRAGTQAGIADDRGLQLRQRLLPRRRSGLRGSARPLGRQLRAAPRRGGRGRRCGSRSTASPPAPAETTEPALGPAERFAAVDTDHSGGISLDEMIKWVAENHPDGSAMMRLFTRG